MAVKAMDCHPMNHWLFDDRLDAARRLAPALAHHRGASSVVLAIPRGAVPMGLELARLLGADFDLVMVRKIGAPGQPELAVAAVDESGWRFEADHAALLGADHTWMEAETRHELERMGERRARWTPGRPPIDVKGRTAIVVDDGLATGATMIAALHAVRQRQPAHLVCAVPLAAAESLARVRAIADEVVCLATPANFGAVGQYYRHFDQVEDEEVARCLAGGGAAAGAPEAVPVTIDLGEFGLDGDLTVPAQPRGLVVFAHGSGSGRRSPRNRQVAAALVADGLATLLLDLLTPVEDREVENRFDIGLLAGRLAGVVRWAARQPQTTGLPMGLFGASTGAASALAVAASLPGLVQAVVSRGGRPDLAGHAALQRVRAPVLLIVGGHDTEVLALNRVAAAEIEAPHEIAIVPGAGHLFEQPGALKAVADLARRWFRLHLTATGREV
jgi:putative phosphoribosyl transferase